jgi:hypothetical protein
MIIFSNSKDLYSCLSDDAALGQPNFAANMKVGAAGNVGVFTVVNQTTKRSFNFGYSCDIWSASETEIITTKIVEIAPQFVLCNQTDHTLRFV